MTTDATAGGQATPAPESLFELERGECLALLRSVLVGRLVWSTHDVPAVQPLNAVVHRGAVYVCTSASTAEKVTAPGKVVAFQADAVDPRHRTGWSVIVLATPAVETDPQVLAELAEIPLVPWAGGERTVTLRLPLELVTGRRVGAGPIVSSL